MRKNDRRGADIKARRMQLDLLPPLHEWVAAAGLAAVMELLERERAALCGMAIGTTARAARFAPAT